MRALRLNAEPFGDQPSGDSFESSQSCYKHELVSELAVVSSTGLLSVLLSLPICSPSSSRPLDHRLSISPLAHRDSPHSLAFHTLRTSQQVIISPTQTRINMRALTYLSLVLSLSLTPTVSSRSTRYKRELSIVGSDFFEEFNWETENDPTHGRVNYLTLEQAKAKNLTYGSLPLPRPAPHTHAFVGAISH